MMNYDRRHIESIKEPQQPKPKPVKGYLILATITFIFLWLINLITF